MAVGERRMGPDHQAVAPSVTSSRLSAGPRRAVTGARGRVQQVGPVKFDLTLRRESHDDEIAVLVEHEVAVPVLHEVG